MEFSILGPLEVRADDHAVALGGIKPRALLAVLILHANEPVSAERLALALWGEDAPAGTRKRVQVNVSRLRKAFGDPDLIVTTPAGYRLRVREGELDAERFETLVAEGRHALAADEADQAGAVLREALGLWRGAPLADLADEPFAADEIARLEEQRLSAIELRVDADLAASHHAELVGELGQLTREHPWRERLHGQLMLALYRSGRQADALDAYRRAREVLVDELGIEPGAELRELHQKVLDQDPSLEASHAAADGAPGPAPAPGRRRWRAVAAAVVLLAVAAVTVAVLVVGGDDDAPESVSVPVDSVAVIDPRTNTVTTALHVDEAPGPIVSGAGLLWVLNLNSETVSRIDPRQARVLRTQGIGNTPGNVTGSAQEVWILTGCTVGAPGELLHLYTARDGGVDMLGGGEVSLAGAVPGPRPPGVPSSTGCGLASRGSTVWVATNIEPGLARVDHDPISLQGRVNWGTPLPQAPAAIAVGAGALWALDAANEVVRRIDAKTGRVVAEVRAGSDPVAVAVGAGSVWVANRGDDSVSRVDPRTNAVSKAISVGDGPLAVAAGTDAVWVSTSDGVVAKIDPSTDKVTARISVGHRSEGIALAAGRVWVTVRR